MQHSYLSFWAVLMSNSFTQPNFTDLVRLTEAMILSEPDIDKKLLDEVTDIYNCTDAEIDIPLGQLEFIVFYQINVQQAGLNKEVELNGKNWTIIQLYGFLDKVNQKLVRIVIEIAKKYNFDLPLGHSSTTKLAF